MDKKVLIIGGIAVLVLGTVGVILYSSSAKKKALARQKELEAKLTAEQQLKYQQLPPSQKGDWLNKVLGIATVVGELGKTGSTIYGQVQQGNVKASAPDKLAPKPVALNSLQTGLSNEPIKLKGK